jgi:alpha-galactosidase
MGIYHSYFDFIEHVNKGHFFDLDMLDIGKCEMFEMEKLDTAHDFGFTDDEKLMVYSSRAFFSSPIQLSCNLDYVTDFELNMYCNDEIIAINQDCAYQPARPNIIIEKGDTAIHVFKKRLEDGSDAYAVFNIGKTKETVTVHLDSESVVRDVWAKHDISTSSKINLTLEPHTVRIVKASRV